MYICRNEIYNALNPSGAEEYFCQLRPTTEFAKFHLQIQVQMSSSCACDSHNSHDNKRGFI